VKKLLLLILASSTTFAGYRVMKENRARVVQLSKQSQSISKLSSDVAKCTKYVNLFIRRERKNRTVSATRIQALVRSSSARRGLRSNGVPVHMRVSASRAVLWQTVERLRSSSSAQDRRIKSLEAKVEAMTLAFVAMSAVQLPSAITPARPRAELEEEEDAAEAAAAPVFALPDTAAPSPAMFFPTLSSPIPPTAAAPAPQLQPQQPAASPVVAAAPSAADVPAALAPPAPPTPAGALKISTLDYLQRLLVSSPFRQSKRAGADEEAEAMEVAAPPACASPESMLVKSV